MNLSTEFADFHFDNCLMNASGTWCRTKEELDEILMGKAGALVTKSATEQMREGNPLPRYMDLAMGSINSMGLPNMGADYYLDYAEENSHKKPIFISVAGLSLEENLRILKKYNNSPANFITELNLSCPNIPGKPQTGYDFERTKEVLQQVFDFYKKPLGVKLPPYFDIAHFQEIAEILKQFPLAFVTCINSIGNALYINRETESVAIKPKNGFGGIGGAYVKPTALANVRQFYILFQDKIPVIGCGGVQTGGDVFEHILCGASMVQIGTQFMKEKGAIFPRILSELKQEMEAHHYASIQDFRGKLKSL